MKMYEGVCFFLFFVLIFFIILLRIHTQRKKKQLQALLQNIYKVSSTRSLTYSFCNNIMKGYGDL